MSGTLLLGYDIESGAVGESEARIPDHSKRQLESLDVDSTPWAMEHLTEVHREFGVKGTLFVCGKTLLNHVDLFKRIASSATDVFDIQQHTYSHVLFKDDFQLGSLHPASPYPLLEYEVASTTRLLEDVLGVHCSGLRTPHGYAAGLTDRPDLVDMLLSHGIRYVSSWARDEHGKSPAPLDVQPFRYGTEFGESSRRLVELPFQYWMDVAWFEEFGIDRGLEFGGVLTRAIDMIVEADSVYGCCFHDWGLRRYRDQEHKWLSTLIKYAREEGVDVMSYSDYFLKKFDH